MTVVLEGPLMYDQVFFFSSFFLYILVVDMGMVSDLLVLWKAGEHSCHILSHVFICDLIL